ncbi:unnamed protein product [Rotaria magnacalcarata]|uniref:MIT domain-containing protein n=1 Tax=Rotaria magnacalcarata TaxID=392030 RepID=A0A814E248_9BILA|nr:unnamed protein product [Rotaria magnacalcarata]CAF1671382.1 unnamed protein product [Rotaria magnacalcarata]CAF2040392.1 unnamed protein product [Rotaria magnacalcarata]CAF2078972.1 unnamed protein product [Rotaria magnacalcarata]CAF2170576.1 unnamed protein product [Rotaria magnacalcarata]
MVNKDNECLTDTVTTESKTMPYHENNSTMLSVPILSDSTSEQPSIQDIINDQNDGFLENKSDDNQLVVAQTEQEGQQQEVDDDEFIRITAAHQMLTEAQTYDEQKKYPAALHLYRICVDLLLEELMFTEGTEQSRVYLREKCTAIMDRIDLLKTMLEPIPPLSSTETLTNDETTTNDETATNDKTTTNEETTKNDEQMKNEEPKKMEEIANPPTEELNSLHIS